MLRTLYRQRDFVGPSSNVAADVAEDTQVDMEQRDCSAAESSLPFALQEGRYCLKKQTGPKLQMDSGPVFHTRAAEMLYMHHHHTNCSE